MNIEERVREVYGDRLTLSVTEAASVLGVSTSTAYRMVAAKQLPTIAVGQRKRVPVTALIDMLDSERNGGSK